MQFLFEGYVLDLGRRELTRGAEPIAIAPQVFDLLVYLVQNRERVVSKDELLDAIWAGRIVSESTLASHINAVRKAVGDCGGEQRLIRTIARKGFRFVADVREAPSSEGGSSEPGVRGSDELATEALPLPDKPSIAVLPFQNLSGDPAQDYFADGMVEDIITDLSRHRWLFVIARKSSFTYRSGAVDVREVRRRLGVGYVLEGSVRKVGDRVRITGRLIETMTGANLWSERFESTVDNVFELQDLVATGVAGALAPQLERAEIERAKRAPTSSPSAYDCYLHGLAKLHQGSREAIAEALPLFRTAIDLDPDFASAYGMAAWCHLWRKVNRWTTDGAEAAEGARLARRAAELGRDDAVALCRSGAAVAYLAGDLDDGIALVDRALVLNPSSAASWFHGGFLRAFNGESDTAIDHFARAMRLSPLDPEMYRMQAGMALAHLFAGRFDGASLWAERAFRNLPSYLIPVSIVAASHALAGRSGQAQRAMRHLRELDPTLRVSGLGEWLPLLRPENLDTLADGLRKAGLPD